MKYCTKYEEPIYDVASGRASKGHHCTNACADCPHLVEWEEWEANHSSVKPMTQREKDQMYLDLNSTLVKFWVSKGRPDKEVRIELLRRMLRWYEKMGYATMDSEEE